MSQTPSASPSVTGTGTGTGTGTTDYSSGDDGITVDYVNYDNNEYIGGYLRGTVYGPEKYLPRKLKRYRQMNAQEYSNYRDKIRKTGGFDVDGCRGLLPGRIVGIHPSSRRNWRLCNTAARFAAIKQYEDGGTHIEFGQLVKATLQPVAGLMFYVTFTATKLSDNIENLYRAKVWGKPTGLELKLFEEVPENESEKSAKELREEIMSVIKEIPPLDDIASSSEEDEAEPQTIMLIPKKGELQSIAFRIFLKEMKRQNPHKKYAWVRRSTSRRWKSLPFPEKLPYIVEAEVEFQRKAGEFE